MDTTKKFFQSIESNKIVEVDAFRVATLDDSVAYRDIDDEEWIYGNSYEFISEDGTIYWCQLSGQCNDHRFDEFWNVPEDKPMQPGELDFDLWAGHETDGSNFFLTIYNDQNGWVEVEMPEDGAGEILRSQEYETGTYHLRKNSKDEYFLEIDSRYPMSDFYLWVPPEYAMLDLDEIFELLK